MNTVPVSDVSDDIRLHVHGLQELPAISPMASLLLNVIGDDRTTIPQLADIIRQDASLTGRIIGLANSAYFAQRTPVTSVEDAIFKALGLRLTQNMALGIALSGPFSSNVACAAFDVRGFWLKAVLTASLCRSLCACIKAFPAPDQDTAYLAGLLHEFGLLPLVYLLPEQMDSLFRERAREPETRMHLLLKRELGVDHHTVGAWLAGNWQLPPAIVEVIAHHADPVYEGEQASLVHLVHFASLWVDGYLRDGVWDRVPGEVDWMQTQLFDSLCVREVLQQQHARFDSLEALSRVLAGDEC